MEIETNKRGRPATRYLIKNQFYGMDNNLRIWNTVCVAMNLCEHISESLAERYIEINLNPEDKAKVMEYTQMIHKTRNPQYGLRKGDVPLQDELGVQMRAKEWT